MKTKKRIPLWHDYKNCDALADYLGAQSQKGWHFKEFQFGMVFEAGKPQKRHYVVEAFPNGMEKDLKPEAEVEEYAAYCEAAGWKFIDSVRKFCVFEQISADAAPIVTPQERFENICQAQWRLWGRRMGVFAVQFLILLMNIRYNRYGLFMNAIVSLFLLTAALCMMELVSGAMFFVHVRKMKRQLAAGKVLHYNNSHGQAVRAFASHAFLIGMVLWIAADDAYRRHDPAMLWAVCILTVLMLAFYGFLAYFRPNRLGRLYAELLAECGLALLLLLLAFSLPVQNSRLRGDSDASLLERMPFTLEDIGQPKGRVSFADYGASESVFGKMVFCSMTYETEHETQTDSQTPYDFPDYESESMVYHIYKSPYAWVLDQVWEKGRRHVGNGWKPCAQEWGAVEGYACAGNYLIRDKDKVLDIMTNQPLDAWQIHTIREKLEDL